jgi:Holliday junction resolvasome RuvABC endonuclease subunit
MILCLDPSFTHFGWSIVDEYGTPIDMGVIVTKKESKKAEDTLRRITIITNGITEILDKHDVRLVLAELPPLGSQSSAAAKGLAIAVAVPTALFTRFSIPVEWTTPERVKIASTGIRNASKEQVMLSACKRYDWKITEKNIYSKKTKQVQRIDLTYYPLGNPMGKSKFEHIADSLGAYEALKYKTKEIV